MDTTALTLPPLIPFNKGGTWGFCNPEREIVIPCQYDEAHFFRQSLAIVRSGVAYSDWHFGMISTTGEVVIPLEYSCLEPFSEGLAKMRTFGKTLYGFLDTSGNTRIHANFETVYSFSEGLAFAQKPLHRRVQEAGFIDTEGVMQLPLTPFTNVQSFNSGFREGIAILEHQVARGSYFSYLLRNGQILTNKQPGVIGVHVRMDWLVRADAFQNGLALVLDEFAGYSIISRLGEVVVNFQHEYKFIGEFQNDCAKVRNGAAYGFIDWAGNEIIPCMIDFHSIGDFHDGLAAFQETENGKFGFVDKQLNTVIPCFFDGVEDFAEGLACVRRQGAYGFINTDGEEVIPCKYDYASGFGNYEAGFALVRKEGRKFYIDKNGVEFVA
ncbi:MAG: WG repeat-containing protein [Candidatus Kapabacteria bacterium]|jgi:hypothetical protein|nr:WG repeat-containing protein [Candidatus Kapabacteria bacterium]